MVTSTLNFHPKKILAFLISINLGFTLLYVGHYLAFNYAPMQLLDLDAESNIPTWYSSAVLLMISLAFITIYSALPKNEFHKTGSFLLASFIFLFLSIDEIAQLHEKFNTNLFGAWIGLYISFCLALLYFLRKEIIHTWQLNQKAVCIGLVGAGFYLLAMTSEYLGFAYYGETYWSKAEKPFGYVLEVALEELFEMTGHSVILYAVLHLFSNDSHVASQLTASVQT